MKNVNKKVIMAILLVGVSSTGLMACKPYNTPEFVDVSPSQTAFAIPLKGDGADQVKLDSEEAVKKNLVTSKRVPISKEWLQTGRGFLFIAEDGKWIPNETVIVVERKPETRAWTEAEGTGTSVVNQGIEAETRGSIAFIAGMNCTASIQENNAAKYLFNYNDRSLKDVMDSEIRAAVESKFGEEIAKRDLEVVLVEKEQIMTAVRTYVEDMFSNKGITINQLGLKGEFSYKDPKVQAALNAKFTAAKDQEAQATINETNKAKAIADAEVIRTQASTMGDTIKLKQAEAAIIEANAKLEMAKSLGNMKDVKVIGNNPIFGSDILK